MVDLLPDREPATVELSLRRHPRIELVARDRNGGYGGYGGAVSRALPRVVQLADRWHLLGNASQAFPAAVQKEMPGIRRVLAMTILEPSLLTAAESLPYRASSVEGRQTRPLAAWPRMVRQSNGSCG